MEKVFFGVIKQNSFKIFEIILTNQINCQKKKDCL